MVDRTAVVVGGGIGGLSAGLALHRAGWQVQVLERAAQLTEIGAGLSLWPNALRALQILGLHERVLELSSVERGGIRDLRGRWLTRSSSDELRRRFGFPLIMVHRADLLRVLSEALPPGVLRCGVEVTELPEAEVVIAADGINSTIRHKLFPGYAPRYAGYTAWRTITHTPEELREGAVTWGRGERFGFTPMTGNAVYCFATATVPPGQSSVDGEYAELVRRFADWPDPIPALLAATDPATVLRHDISELPAIPAFVHDRVALLGDAAHAMTPNLGQGACQALEDAIVLTECLTETTDVPAALTRYDALRRPRTQAIIRRSARIGRIAQLAWPPAVAVRNLAARLAPDEVTIRSVADILSWRM